MTDSELATLAAGGDRAALALLLQDHEPALLAYARRRLPPAVRSIIGCDDIVQETCMEACRRIGDFVPRDDKAFGCWLFKIANFKMLNAIRRVRSMRKENGLPKEVDDELVGMLDNLRSFRRSPSASAVAHEFVRAVEAALLRLPRRFKQVLRLRFIEGLSVEQVATITKNNINSVYVTTSLALPQLRLELLRRKP